MGSVKDPEAGRIEALPKAPEGSAAHIARVAARLFADRGFDATSVREIVEASGVTKPTLYYHFGSKQGLAEALLTRPMAEFIASLRALLEHELDPLALLRGMFATHIDFITTEPDRGRLLYVIAFGPQNSSLRDELHWFGEALDQVTEGIAARLAEAGLIEVGRVASCTQVIRGLYMSASLDHIFACKPIETGLADRLVGDLLLGFARPGSTILERWEGRR